MPKPSHLAALGVGPETTRGDAATPTIWVPWTTLTPTDNVAQVEDTGQRGSTVDVYGLTPGKKGSELDLGGAVFADSFGFPLASVLADVTTTGNGTSTPYAHTFGTLNSGDTQPSGQTWTIDDPLGCWQYAGMQCSELGLAWNADGLLMWTAKYAGWTYAELEDPPEKSFSGTLPIPNWATVTKLNSAAVFVLEGSLSIKRSVTAIQGPDGTQNPYAMWSGDVVTDGKLTLVPENTDWRTAYQEGTSTAVGFGFTTGTGLATSALALALSHAKITEGTPTYGQDYIEQPITFRGVGNTSDVGASGGYGAVTASLTNTLPAGTYT